MKYHAIITIIDDKNNEITRMVKEEERQYEMPKNNVVLHEFFIGALSIPEGREMCQFIEEMKGGFVSSQTEVVKVGEPIPNSDEINKALEKGELYK